jgi:elongation factor 1-alpha
MQELKKAIERGEGEEIEFKRNLKKESHLSGKRKVSLAGQMKNRLLLGDGEATYVIGVSDDGEISGITESQFNETVEVISSLADDTGAMVDEIEKTEVDDKLVGMIKIKEVEEMDKPNHILIGTAGHVDHGKSTIVSSIVSDKADDGEGKLRKELDLLPHEIERGLSADLSYSVYGFKDDETITLDSNRKEDIVKNSDKLISFVDTVGHKPWLGTAIRGLVGQRLDYGMLVIAADEGVTDTTREHLGILLAVDLPTMVVITKTDLVDDEQVEDVEKEIEKVLRNTGCRSISVDRHGIKDTTEEVIKSVEGDKDNICPVFRTSAVEKSGIDELNHMIRRLPKVNYEESEDFQMYIDETYQVSGVGTVVCGTVKSGNISKGDEILIGPDSNGEYRQTKAKSLEIHYHEVETAETGQIVSVALQNIEPKDIERGMILTDKDNPNSSQEFIADILVLNHPTSISDGYEPVIHLETINEVAEVDSDEPLLAGEKGEVKFKFKFNSYFVEEGQKFIFREGDAKGIGTIKEI